MIQSNKYRLRVLLGKRSLSRTGTEKPLSIKSLFGELKKGESPCPRVRVWADSEGIVLGRQQGAFFTWSEMNIPQVRLCFQGNRGCLPVVWATSTLGWGIFFTIFGSPHDCQDTVSGDFHYVNECIMCLDVKSGSTSRPYGNQLGMAGLFSSPSLPI